MNLKKSGDLLNFYKSSLRFSTSILWSLLPRKLGEYLISLYTFKNMKKYRLALLGAYFSFFSVISFVIYYYVSNKEEVMTGFVFGLLIILILVFMYSQKIVDYYVKTLPDDHYFQLLGHNKFSFLINQVKNNSKRLFINYISFTLTAIVLMMVYNGNNLLIVIYLMLIYLIYIFSIILTYLRLIISASNFKFSIVFNYVVKYMFYVITILLLISSFYLLSFLNNIIFHYAFNINEKTIPVKLTILSSIYLIIVIFILYYVRKVMFEYLTSHSKALFVNRKYNIKHKNNLDKHYKIPFVLNHLTKKESAIVVKDFKLLFRAKHVGLAMIIISNLIPGIFSIFIIGTDSGMNKVIDFNNLIFMNVMMINIVLFFASFNFFSVKRYTWLSSEMENFFIYNMTKLSYMSLLKAKKRVNYLLLMPQVFIFAVITAIGLLFNIGIIYFWIFSIIYFYLVLKFIIDKIIYYDFVGPKVNLTINNRWIGDNSTLGFIFMVLVVLVPVAVQATTTSIIKTINQSYFYMLGLIILLLGINILTQIQTRNIKKIKRITFGGVSYDKV